MIALSMDLQSKLINMAGIAKDSIVDGPGIRVALFCQGCTHGCLGCHNPETHPLGTGTDLTVDDLYRQVRCNPLARGVTFSGGEPFLQADAFATLAAMLQADGYELAAYTGFTLEQLLQGTAAQQALLRRLDVLVDGPFVQAQRNLDLRWRGSENQRILDVQASLRNGVATPSTDPRWGTEAVQP